MFNRIDVDKTGQLTLDQLVEALRVDFLGTVAMLGLLGSQTKKSEDVVTVVEQKSRRYQIFFFQKKTVWTKKNWELMDGNWVVRPAKMIQDFPRDVRRYTQPNNMVFVYH